MKRGIFICCLIISFFSGVLCFVSKEQISYCQLVYERKDGIFAKYYIEVNKRGPLKRNVYTITPENPAMKDWEFNSSRDIVVKQYKPLLCGMDEETFCIIISKGYSTKRVSDIEIKEVKNSQYNQMKKKYVLIE